MLSSPAASLFPAQLDTLGSTPLAANNQATTLSSSVSADATTLPVASTSSFPASGAVTIGSEIIFYAGVGANSLMNCVRGYDGTSSTTHTAGDAVEMLVIAAHANIVATGLIAVEAKLGSGASMPVAGTVLQATGAGTTEWGTLNASVLTSGTIDPARIPVSSRLDNNNNSANVSIEDSGQIRLTTGDMGIFMDVDNNIRVMNAARDNWVPVLVGSMNAYSMSHFYTGLRATFGSFKPYGVDGVPLNIESVEGQISNVIEQKDHNSAVKFAVNAAGVVSAQEVDAPAAKITHLALGTNAVIDSNLALSLIGNALIDGTLYLQNNTGRLAVQGGAYSTLFQNGDNFYFYSATTGNHCLVIDMMNNSFAATGGLKLGKDRAATAATTIAVNDYALYFDTTAGSINQVLPSAVGQNGREILVFKSSADGNTLTVSPATGQGVITVLSNLDACVTYRAFSDKWRKVSQV